MNAIAISNNQAIQVSLIPELAYPEFLAYNTGLVKSNPAFHCVTYFGMPQAKGIKLYCAIANDETHEVLVNSSVVDTSKALPSFAAQSLSFEKFERELTENHGIAYADHPWLKPVRYPFNRHDAKQNMDNYPFFSIQSEELHEVGVGPVHAGVIEPGHFRFICNGEQILHLEIQLGYQHRGIETLFLTKNNLLQRSILAESIAGDSVIEHASAFAFLMESLSGFEASKAVLHARTLAQELERIAIHTGDLSAICTDIAYQLGSSVFGRLRTPIINYFQEWCGNRLAKSLIRPYDHNYHLTPKLAERLHEVLNAFEPDFVEMNTELFNLPSALSRLERTGTVTAEQVASIGTAGPSARMNGLARDIRKTHPYALYGNLAHEPIIKHHGDVYSRAQIRKQEVMQSIAYVRSLLEQLPEPEAPRAIPALAPNSFALSLTEGWRGEVCHAAITGEDGQLIAYKIKDPSFHNWLALALSVRNNEISDFPICNKSFNLSYCGHDL
jgi:Ni,Fe-hydrogenase III large subunit